MQLAKAVARNERLGLHVYFVIGHTSNRQFQTKGAKKGWSCGNVSFCILIPCARWFAALSLAVGNNVGNMSMSSAGCNGRKWQASGVQDLR